MERKRVREKCRETVMRVLGEEDKQEHTCTCRRERWKT